MESKPSFVDQLDVDYISHHGIKGMKWGVRRYQNVDGSYTSQGKARRNKSNFSDKKIAKKVAIGLGAAGIAAGGLYLANKVSAKKSIDDARKAVEEANKLANENLRIADEESKRISNPNISKKEIHSSFNKVNDAANRSMDAEKKAAKAVRNAEMKNYQGIGDDDISSYPYRMTDEYMPHYGPSRWFNALKQTHPDIYEAEYKKADEHWAERRRKRADEQYGIWTPSPLKHADIYSNKYLAHHGIKGQKWGVRRYQNADGSYTALGAANRKQGKSRRTSSKSKGAKIVLKHLSDKWNSMDPKVKKNIIKGATTLAYIGGISAYGHSKGGKGVLGSYMTGINEISENNPLSKAIVKRINRRQSKHDDYDLDDMGPTIYRNSDGKVVNEDDIW